jgi:hypothetical protein
MRNALCGAVLVVAAAVAVPLAQNSRETPYAATRLISRWRTVMSSALESARAFAAEDVADEMEVFISPGAVRAIQDKATEEQLKKADAVLERFVAAMVRAGEKRPDGSVIVDAATIEPAAKAVCPVYPFCS